MYPAFAAIRFGPFASVYHREAVDDAFKRALSTFLEAELLPQVEQPYESASGRLTAAYDDPRHCGPRSAVRDIYRLEFAFHRPAGSDTVEADLVFDPRTLAFAARPHRPPLYLRTATRRRRDELEVQAIRDVCRRIADHEPVAAVCPLCSSPLRVVDMPELFDVRCPGRCFNLHSHRDPATGGFLHGHFFRRGLPGSGPA